MFKLTIGWNLTDSRYLWIADLKFLIEYIVYSFTVEIEKQLHGRSHIPMWICSVKILTWMQSWKESLQHDCVKIIAKVECSKTLTWWKCECILVNFVLFFFFSDGVVTVFFFKWIWVFLWCLSSLLKNNESLIASLLA